MRIYQVASVGTDYTTQSNQVRSKDREKKKETAENISPKETPAAVYEKTEYVKPKVSQPDRAQVKRMIREAEERSQKLRDLVEKLLLKQGQKITSDSDIYNALREGKVEVDEETRLQAQKDIAEDGYWGIEQTSERLLSFAKALSGNDPTKADELIEAVKKGFEKATKAWGGQLPEICKKTIDKTVEKLENWRDSISDKEE